MVAGGVLATLALPSRSRTIRTETGGAPTAPGSKAMTTIRHAWPPAMEGRASATCNTSSAPSRPGVSSVQRLPAGQAISTLTAHRAPTSQTAGACRLTATPGGASVG